MKRYFTLAFVLVFSVNFGFAQLMGFPEVAFDGTPAPDTVILPPSPFQSQILFIGGYHKVQTTPTYSNPTTEVLAKQWNDFIGWTPDGKIRTFWWKSWWGNFFYHRVKRNKNSDLGWVTINHEMTQSNDFIGDGGGMTVFKIKRDEDSDSLIIVDQNLPDGRSGKYFNVDFANTVGETGMNCAGISAYSGRVWTAEEWFRSSNEQISAYIRDTSDAEVKGGFKGLDGNSIKKYQNLNWMVEVDPKTATAVRKQYNWGRQPFEGGMILPDNKTVFLGVDATPGFFTKFVAKRRGDFTKGKTFVFKHDSQQKWIEIDNTDITKMLNFTDEAIKVGATMFNRLEWVSFNPKDGNIYVTETGRDNPASRWEDEYANGAIFASHHIKRATDQGTTPTSPDYWDYYGRILKFDILKNEMSVFLEGGPYLPNGSPASSYPDKHLSNPDGLSFLKVKNKIFMIIQEDLNGTSFGRVPDEESNSTCELFILDLSIKKPSINDLIRVAVLPIGAEVTGAIATDDGKSVLFNVQHPSSENPFPYNNSLTIAINGWDKIEYYQSLKEENKPTEMNELSLGMDDLNIFPNPTAREVHFNKVMDVAIYNSNGKLQHVKRNSKYLNVSRLKPGTYFLKFANGESKTLIIQR